MDTYNVMLTEEEYDAVMEAREEVYNESIQRDVKKTLNKAGKAVNHAAKDVGKGVNRTAKAVGKALGIKGGHHSHSYSKKSEPERPRIYDTKVYNKAKELPGESRIENGKGGYSYRPINSTKGKVNESFDIVKEAVLDWYEENGIEIDDYEMGRIDSFVENYIEENFDTEEE